MIDGIPNRPQKDTIVGIYIPIICWDSHCGRTLPTISDHTYPRLKAMCGGELNLDINLVIPINTTPTMVHINYHSIYSSLTSFLWLMVKSSNFDINPDNSNLIPKNKTKKTHYYWWDAFFPVHAEIAVDFGHPTLLGRMPVSDYWSNFKKLPEAAHYSDAGILRVFWGT